MGLLKKLKSRLRVLVEKFLAALICDEKPASGAPAASGTAEAPAASGASETPETSPAEEAPPSDDDVPFKSLDFRWGGFKPSSSASAEARIGSLKVSSGGLSYKWVDGGCERLGASSREDASCLACLFCKTGDSWVGGKFDWISTSRLQRGFENIRDHYNGWQPEALDEASAFAFVIVSSNGRKRTNVVMAKR